MAFATANVQHVVFGKLHCVYGDWSGAVGDAAGTFAVAGGRVYFADFNLQPTAPSQYQVSIPYQVALSGTISTLTVFYNEAVTAGSFIIIYS